MNRPYRDNEERQARQAMVKLEDAQWAIQHGNLDEACDRILEAEAEFAMLDDMVSIFDKEEALREAE